MAASLDGHPQPEPPFPSQCAAVGADLGHAGRLVVVSHRYFRHMLAALSPLSKALRTQPAIQRLRKHVLNE